MGANPHANGGQLLRDLVMPDFRTYAVSVGEPGATDAEDTRVLGRWLRDVVTLNAEQRNFRLFGPDETVSNRLDAVFEATSRQWMGEQTADDEWLAPDGRVMEMLSEHQCQGWLEGYLLTGGTGCSIPTKRSSTSWTRCSTSMRNGCRRRARWRGASRSHR